MHKWKVFCSIAAMNRFNNRLKYGAIGETIVKDWLISKGYTAYLAEGNNAHPFDMLVARDKKAFTIVEVKTQCKSKYKPDIGINYSVYQDYLQAQKQLGMKVFIVFVDWSQGCAYGGFIDTLNTPAQHRKRSGDTINYPCKMDHSNKYGDIFERWYFYQPSMKVLFKLTEQQIKQLKAGCKTEYNYENQRKK